jgi:hypothetical protein
MFKALYYRVVDWVCRLLGHAWREDVLWIAGHRCSGVQCRRCKTIPELAAPDDVTYRTVPARTIRAYLAGLPDWMVDECLAWTPRTQEAGGHTFPSGQAAADGWLYQAQHVLPTIRTDAREPQ